MCLEPDLKEGSHIRGKTPEKTSGNLVQLRSVEELDAGPPAGVTTDRSPREVHRAQHRDVVSALTAPARSETGDHRKKAGTGNKPVHHSVLCC